MKIALLHYTYPPTVGGVESVMASHAALFREHGHEVTVYAGDSGDVVMPELRRSSGVQSAELVARLAPLLGREDVVFVHNVCTMPFHPELTRALWQLAAVLPHVRFVAWVHDLAAANPEYESTGISILLRQACPELEYVAVSALRARQVLELLGVPACRVIPNGIDPLTHYGVPPAWREVLPQGKDLVLLHPARLVRRKGVEIGLRVLATLRGRGCDAALLITGPADPHHAPSAEYARELHTLREALGLQEHAIFLSDHAAVSEAAVASFYRVADAVLYPSLSEGFGLPLLEAALHGRPVFYPAVEPLTGLLGESPCSYPPGTPPEEIAVTIMRQVALSAAIQNRRRVAQQYAWPAVYRNYLAPLLAKGKNYPPS